MRLLHLSDIHFKSPDCLNPQRYPEVAYRTRLEADLADLCRVDGVRVDAILVGGDIAFKGDPDEYKAASAWLLKIAGICGCRPDGIFTVPGNHDVNRRVCEKPGVSALQQAIAAGTTVFARDAEFERQLRDVDSARLLFSPLEAYNHFAAPFDCNVYPDRPFWIHDLELNAEVKLRLFGLTSTFISGSGDRDSAPARLFLGSSQTSLNPEPNVVNLVLCHHPPGWFTDGGESNNTINARAMLQFFGHEHDQRCDRLPTYTRFSAGATNPERDKPGWNPGYNLIDLQVAGEGVDRKLEVTGQLRRLQPPPQEFYVPLEATKGQPIWRHTMSFEAPPPPLFGDRVTLDPLPVHHAVTKMAKAAHQAALEAGAEATRRQTEEPPQETTVPGPSTQNLAYRYWQLTGSQMREIALDLKLMTEADLKVPQEERYSKVLRAAKEKGLVEDLARRVEQFENKA